MKNQPDRLVFCSLVDWFSPELMVLDHNHVTYCTEFFVATNELKADVFVLAKHNINVTFPEYVSPPEDIGSEPDVIDFTPA